MPSRAASKRSSNCSVTRTSRPRWAPTPAWIAEGPRAIISISSNRLSPPASRASAPSRRTTHTRPDHHAQSTWRADTGIAVQGMAPSWIKQLWEAAFRYTGRSVGECGPASHLAEATRRAMRSSYGIWLRFLSAKHPERLAGSPSERIDRELSRRYVAWRRRTCGDRRLLPTSIDCVLQLPTCVPALICLGCCRSQSAWQTRST